MKKLLPMKKQLIFEKPSATIAISDPMTTIQRKFYNALLYVAKEDLKKEPTKSEFEIPLNELKNFFDIEDKKNTYLKEKLEELVKLTAKYNILDKDIEEWGIFSLLPFVRIYIDKKNNIGIVKFEIPSLVKKAILNKEKNFFARLDLVIIRGLSSKYSVILYELLKDYENVEIPEMTMEKFREIFGITNKYKKIPDLKRRVLNTAINEINNNPEIEWEVNYELRKMGPRYTHIKFVKSKKDYAKQFQLEKEQKIESAKVQAFLGLVPEKERTKALENYLWEIKNKYEFEYIEAQIKYTNISNPKNYIAYLKQAIKEDYAGYEELKKQDKQNRKEFHDFLLRAQNIYKNKILPKREIEFEEFLREYIYIQFQNRKITEKQKEMYLEYWDELFNKK